MMDISRNTSSLDEFLSKIAGFSSESVRLLILTSLLERYAIMEKSISLRELEDLFLKEERRLQTTD